MRIKVELLVTFLILSAGLALIGAVILPFLTESIYVRPLYIYLFVLWIVFLGFAPIWIMLLAFLAELRYGNLPARSRWERTERLEWVLRHSAVGALFGAIWGAIMFKWLFGVSAIICGALVGALVGSIWAHVVKSK